MKLLTNNQTARWIKSDLNGRMQTAFIASAAIHGPWRKEFDMDSLMSYLLGVAIVSALVVACLDITIWRP
jgi:hypothetical protein